MRTPSMTPIRLFSIAGTLAALSHAALAQNALGDGRALDANLQQGGGRTNAPGRNSNFAEEVRFRNAIVTGNAPGGMSFRGDAGYLSSDDFRAPIGSDNLFSFQRDSLFSGLATRNIRGVDALRAQMALTTGGAPTFGTSEMFINRAGSLSSSGDFRRDMPELSVDPFSSRVGSLRSSSTFLSTQSIEPQFFGSIVDQSGRPYAVGASALRGIIAQPLVRDDQAQMPVVPGTLPMNDPETGQPVQPQEQASTGLRFDADSFGAPAQPTPPGAATERTARPGQVVTEPSVGRITDAVTPGRLTTDAVSNRVAPRTVYESILDQLAAPPTAPAAEPSETFDPTRLPTDPPAPDAGEQPAAPAAQPTEEDRRKFTERLEDLRREMTGLPPIDRTQPTQRVDEEGNTVIEADPQAAIRTIRERAAEFFGDAAINIETLVPRGATDISQYNQLMREGERLLQQQRWFDAEEAFTRAINRRNGDPMAAAGRINAQLGAAMYLSASVNLRALFTVHPELAAVRFSDELFLRGSRLDQVIAYLRDEAAKDRPFAREAALLLAFIGHQRDDSREIRNAFNAIDRVNTELPTSPDPLLEMLKGAWLDAPARRAKE
ncbi:MAG: hypothetical protein KF684_04650 [Phycisphaeraceae bacterium]|nr:hypothetical protein [Phycisphaeraceae bacterium]